MIPYVGCEHARELLDPFVDGELTVPDQVAVESHLRWCGTCRARVEDLRLIAASIRVGSLVPRTAVEDPHELGALQSSVLVRIRAEREQSLGVRLPELFTDMRLLWPALGATVAVLLCVAVAFGVLQGATKERPESLAAMFESLAPPGSERNPLRPDNAGRVDRLFEKYVDSHFAGGISLPRVLNDGSGLEGLANEEAMFALATVVSREGRIANYELLQSGRAGARALTTAAHVDRVEAVRDVVRQSRFAPAQTPIGRAVAVNMVWLIVVTTTTAHTPEATRAVAPARTRVAAKVPPVVIPATNVVEPAVPDEVPSIDEPEVAPPVSGSSTTTTA